MANEHYANEFYIKAAQAEISKTIVSKKANVCPFAIRLAWHASGTFDKDDSSETKGGSDGATMRFEPEITDGANAGLALMQDIVRDVKAKFGDLSTADIWTLAGKQAVELTGGPTITWRPGRSDAPDNATCPPNGRLPDAAQGAQHLRDVFYRMGFGDKEIVALSGAHTLGSCHRLRSGFDGPWTTNPLKFDNEYFKNLLDLEWKQREWEGPVQFQDPSGKLMMLPSDMALLEDPKFLEYVKLYAADEQAFFKDFADAFSALIAKGCPAHVQPEAAAPIAATGSDDNAIFRDMAMHGSLERMKEVVASSSSLNVNSLETHSNRTALHKASFFGHANVVQYLTTTSFANGTAHVNALDADGDTPLHDASRFGHVAVVEALLQTGADKSIRNKDGKLPADLAVANDKAAVVQALSA